MEGTSKKRELIKDKQSEERKMAIKRNTENEKKFLTYL